MPRDVNGNYTLPAGNPVQSGTVIESTWANALTSDLAAEMTDSLSRSGKGGFTDSVGIVDGVSGGVPGLRFSNESTSGMLRATTGDVRLAALGIDKLRIRGGDTTLTQVWMGAANGWEDIATTTSLGVPTGNKAMSGLGGTTKLWFYSAIPNGWTAAPPDGNVRALMAGTVVQIAGTQDPTNLTDSIVVSFSLGTGGAPVPHTHPVVGSAGALSGEVNVILQGSGAAVNVAGDGHSHDMNFTSGADSDTVHTHVIEDSDPYALSLTPRYAEGLIGVLDA